MRGFVLVKIFLFVALFFCAACSEKLSLVQQDQIHLSNPIIESDSVFFTQDLRVKVGLGLENVEIRYTLDTSEPNLTSNLYSDEIILKESAKIKTRAFHSDYLPSEIVSAQFIKTRTSNLIKSIKLNREPHEKYQGVGVSGLTDYIKGTKDYKSSSWLGFSGGDLEIIAETTDKELVSQLILSFLSHQSAWIFLPESIEIYTANQQEDYTLVSTKNVVITEENSESELRFVELDFSKQEAKFVKIIIKNISEIPAWHAGKGTPPWLFIDEVLLK